MENQVEIKGVSLKRTAEDMRRVLSRNR